jgi:protein TonB
MGGQVAEANVIRRVEPLYPLLARTARVQGTVQFTAVISKEGRVEKLQLVRGHPLLVNAARETILQWRYRPTMLNGQPVEVVTSITVNFTLTQ